MDKCVQSIARLVFLGAMILVAGLTQTGSAAQPVRLAVVSIANVPLDDVGEKVVDINPSTAGGPIGEDRIGKRSALVEAEVNWPMAGANPQRTSWTPEEVRGQLKPLWYRPIEPYISQKVQIIAANGMLYVSTARGLYALDADTGAEKWVYPTEMPLGHSPTISNGVAYVGGFDHKLHAINAFTGQKLWTFEAEAGFDTNPLVVNNLVYVGNRDGYMYAVYADNDPKKGTLAWKYKTDGPVLFSAAYKDNTIYFASDDSRAYALNATTGQEVWKPPVKLPGAGFHSWWPVIYADPQTHKDYVIFAGSQNYRTSVYPYWPNLASLDTGDVFPNNLPDPRGTLVGARGQTPGDWATGTVTIDDSRVTQYYESKPWRRTVFVLDRATGQEYTFDYDHDGKPEYAPILWAGTHSGNRYPPVVGSDNVLYQFNVYQSAPYIPAGHISGWKFGSPFISIPSSRWTAMDEPIAYSAGGNLIYWNHTLARSAGAFDITVPNTSFPDKDGTREWVYFDYNLSTILPDFPGEDWWYGGANGVYSAHGDQNSPIPYRGKVFMHRDNMVIAWGNYTGQPSKLAMAATVPMTSTVAPLNTDQLKQRLSAQVQKILDAGHLRPGYMSTGHFDLSGSSYQGDALVDYWHNPADTIYTLIRALPYLDESMQQHTKQYLQTEFASYPPCGIGHIGWKDGVAREIFDLPPEVESARKNYGAEFVAEGSKSYEGWQYWIDGQSYCSPHSFYALWQYAKVFGGAKTIFDSYHQYLQPIPSDSTLQLLPEAHNAFIAGYWGYLELQKLAGYPESSSVRSQLNHLLTLRATPFTKENLARDHFVDGYGVVLAAARNFMYLVPELAQYLHDHALAQVQDTVDYYNDIAPYWFVSEAEEHGREGAIQPLYDTNMFQAQALILNEPRAELEKYLDVPAFARGDLFYIQNLVAALEASGEPEITKSASSLTVYQNQVVTYTLAILDIGVALTQTLPITVTDLLPTGLAHSGGLCASSQGAMPTCSSTGITWMGGLSTTAPVVISYTAQITTPKPSALTNWMQVDARPYGTYTRLVTIMATPLQVYLPLILKEAGG